nr:cytochrome P450 [Bacillus subtilis]
MKETSPIPQPKTFGLLGNLPLIDKDKPTLSLIKLAEEQADFSNPYTRGHDHCSVRLHELVKEVCDEERFDKSIEGALEKVRAFSGDGLFTSWTHEPNWRKAHNILMPTFSQRL